MLRDEAREYRLHIGASVAQQGDIWHMASLVGIIILNELTIDRRICTGNEWCVERNQCFLERRHLRKDAAALRSEEGIHIQLQLVIRDCDLSLG